MTEKQNGGTAVADEPKTPATPIDAASQIKAELARMEKNFEEKFIAQENRIKELTAKNKGRGVSLPGVDEEKEKFSFFYALRYAAAGDRGLPLGTDPRADFTKSVIDEATKKWQAKAMDSQVDTLGGFVVPNQYIAQIIERLRPETIALSLGATQMPGLTGSPVEMPKQTGSATASWTAENAEMTATDMALGQVSMTPHALTALIKLSRRSVMLSNPALEQLAMNDITQQFARALDLAAFEGTGVSNQPLGIKNQPSVGSSSLASVSFAKLVDFIGVVQDADAFRGRLGWAFKPAGLRLVEKLVDSQGKPIFDFPGAWSQNTGLDQAPWSGRLLGFPALTSTQLSSGHVYFGNFAELLMASWGTLILESSTQTSDAFAKHQMWVKGVLEADIAVRHPQSFVVATDLS